ncbi:ankyrin repeat-containing domain protein [Gigaspora rosea]|uniref:Ankyrin repeat-containing domain protein n=1 Tax=Gigaspora rosea TaxID=44941 RepID=A0A397VFZ7_9GLOM|nr:ankyrin repeat-containing domain protein [Gigaspora rosea]
MSASIHVAALEGHFHTVQQIIRSEPTAVNSKDEIGTLLLERSANLNLRDQNNQTPLHRCAVRGYTMFVKLLFEKGATPNVADKVKNTPLHLACEEGFGDCALVLIENGGDITLENAEKKTPLDLCKKELRAFILQQTSTEE